MCQKSHFLHTSGRVIDVDNARRVDTVAACPPINAVEQGTTGDGSAGSGFTQADCVEAGAAISEEGAEAFCAAVFALPTPDVQQFVDNAQTCSFDETGPNCVYNAAFDGLDGESLALLLAMLAEQCTAGGDALCQAIDSAVPDLLPVLSSPVVRGALEVVDTQRVVPAFKTVDGSASDWVGRSSYIGGSQHYAAGEHVYTDYLFDARGADDGDDARRLLLLGPVAELNARAGRLDQLAQALGDQLGVPRPLGASDAYGEATPGDGADLHEVRWARQGDQLLFGARLVNLVDAAHADLLLLFDTDMATPDGASIGFGLQTSQFDVAVRVNQQGVQAWQVATGETLALVAESAIGLDDNLVELSLPATAVVRDGVLKVAVVSLDGNQRPANVAYRFGEPVAGVYNEQHQALALWSGSVDPFLNVIDVDALVEGVDEQVRPGVGYHERQFISGANISTESGEHGRLQHYGLYLPTGYDGATATPITYWLHYRGGKAHSGAAWTPRLIHQLGEAVGNIVVTPRGRGTSTWYTTDAHQDVFEVMLDAEGLDVRERAPTVEYASGLARYSRLRSGIHGQDYRPRWGWLLWLADEPAPVAAGPRRHHRGQLVPP